MSYKSKYTGLQIDDLLDSVGGKQNEIEDLDSIRAGAAKGATALQSYTEKYTGTITGVSANGTSIATSGVANIPAASTSTYGVTKLSSATNSTSTTLAATASAVKAAYDLANGKQDTLVSGTNIKTINGASILGSGDIVISGGSSDANVQAVDTGDVIDDVIVNYATTAYVDSKVANIDLANYTTTAYVDGLVGDINSVLESIINGSASPTIITFTIAGTEYQAEEGMTFYDWGISKYYDNSINLVADTQDNTFLESCRNYGNTSTYCYNKGGMSYTPNILLNSVIQPITYAIAEPA